MGVDSEGDRVRMWPRWTDGGQDRKENKEVVRGKYGPCLRGQSDSIRHTATEIVVNVLLNLR